VGCLIEIVSGSPEETLNLGQRIAEHLRNGSIVAVYGTLGSGKTVLTKGIARALGINENITSPTYTIINDYPIIINNDLCNFYHIDAYRLNNSKDFTDIGGLEIIHSNGITVIEWSENIEKILPKEVIKVSFKITGSQERLIQITGAGFNTLDEL